MLQYTNSRRTAFRFKENSSDWQPESKNENKVEEKRKRGEKNTTATTEQTIRQESSQNTNETI